MNAPARQASYIVTYRQGEDASRRENLLAVLTWLARYPMFEVILVEQDDAPRLQGALPHPHCRHVFVYNAGPFNKSWGYNVGFRLSTAPWFAFGDADMIVGDALPDALSYLGNGYKAVKPYKRLIDLDAQRSRRVIDGDLDVLQERDAQGSDNREGQGEFIVFAGGVFLIARDAFVRVGGWDERFLGWGGEDDAMSYKIERSRMPAVELDQGPALHLWHSRTASAPGKHAHYASNCAVLDDYRRQSDAELLRFSEIQMQIIGNRDKYRPQ